MQAERYKQYSRAITDFKYYGALHDILKNADLYGSTGIMYLNMLEDLINQTAIETFGAIGAFKIFQASRKKITVREYLQAKLEEQRKKQHDLSTARDKLKQQGNKKQELKQIKLKIDATKRLILELEDRIKNAEALGTLDNKSVSIAESIDWTQVFNQENFSILSETLLKAGYEVMVIDEKTKEIKTITSPVELVNVQLQDGQSVSLRSKRSFRQSVQGIFYDYLSASDPAIALKALVNLPSNFTQKEWLNKKTTRKQRDMIFKYINNLAPYIVGDLKS